MLDELIASYRTNIGNGQTPQEAARAVANEVAQNTDILADTWRELATIALPMIGAFHRSKAPALAPGKPWYDRAEVGDWRKIPVPIGNTGRRLVTAKIGKIEARTIGQFFTRQGKTIVKLGGAWNAASDEMKNGEKLPDVLPRLAKEQQRVIGEYVLSYRSALSA